jgi:CrcB protein
MVDVMAREHFQLRRLLAVFCGGFLGTLARYLLMLAIGDTLGNGWPYSILLINITGAFVLAFLTMLAEEALFIGPTRRLLLNVGFVGAYTTFSTFALGAVTLFSEQQMFLALLYLVCSLVGGVVAILLGQICGYRLIQYVRSARGLLASKPLATASVDLMGRKASTQSLQEEEQTY